MFPKIILTGATFPKTELSWHDFVLFGHVLVIAQFPVLKSMIKTVLVVYIMVCVTDYDDSYQSDIPFLLPFSNKTPPQTQARPDKHAGRT